MDDLIDKEQLSALAERYRLKFVILHGSQATGRATKRSDVDIAVVTERGARIDDRFLELYGDLARLIRRGAGEFDFKEIPAGEPLFRYHVVRDGKLLYGDPAAYEAYRQASLRFYVDSRDLLDLEHRQLRKYQRHLDRIGHA